MSAARVSSAPIDLGALTAAVNAPRHGAIATFVGIVRNVNEGRPVVALEYSAYDVMAARELERIVAEAQTRWPGSTVMAEHRTGLLQIGDVSVAIVVATPHRADAFAACRHVIEELKRRVPIWKREHYADGTREWVDPTEGITHEDHTGHAGRAANDAMS